MAPDTEGDSGPAAPTQALSRLVQRARETAAADDMEARAQFWRGKSEYERSAAFVSLMQMSDYAARHRLQPYQKPPLDFPRFSSTGGHDATR